MTDKLVLEAKIPLECHVVQADVSVATEVSHVLPILMHIHVGVNKLSCGFYGVCNSIR